MVQKLKKYDYLIVGAGLFGSTFAYLASQSGKKCLVIDKRSHVGGNCYSRKQFGIDVHLYGPHILHTSNEETWKFVDSLSPMKPFINQPLACYNGKIYNLPFNMNTFCQIYGKPTPSEIVECIQKDLVPNDNPLNLEEYALATVGRTIYEILIKGYTEKQWGKKCTELPASILKRLPLRMTFDNSYFEDKFQGVPENGYDHLFYQMLRNCDVAVDCDFFSNEELFRNIADKILYTGRLDHLYIGDKLEFRGLRFNHVIKSTSNFQGNAVVNYTDTVMPYTRITEHHHFNPRTEQACSVVSFEYPVKSSYISGDECYPVPTERNLKLQEFYEACASEEKRMIFGGRLADYQYYNMDTTIEKAIALWKRESK